MTSGIKEMVQGEASELVRVWLHGVQDHGVGGDHIDCVVQGPVVFVGEHDHVTNYSKVMEGQGPVGLQLGESNSSGLNFIKDR